MRLSAKLLIYNLLAKGLILLIFISAAPFVLKYFAVKNTDNQLREKRDEVISIIVEDGMEKFISSENPEIGFGSYNILKEEYILLELWEQGLKVDTIFVEDRILERETVTYRVYSNTFEYGGDTYILEIGRSLETIKAIERIIYNILIGTLVIFLALTFFLDTAFTEKILQPFKKIINQKISQINEPQQFSYQLIKTNTEEFKLLDNAISDMMRRIQKAFNQERIFISHASHELKTPISVLQSKVEALFSREEIGDLEMEKLLDMQMTIQQMKKTVNALLLISKVNNAQYIKTETVQINLLIEELLEEWEDYADDKEIVLALEKNDPFSFESSNESLCRMMIQNAFINALKYTPKGGKISVISTSTNSHHQVIIKDTGPGISDDLLEQVKDGIVFLKDAEKDKSGFGLQIMFKVALYLDVMVDIKSSTDGTAITFTCPIQQD
ncbi:Signal transduction histidine kinase [Belliella buryatensis]|uniref:histidine kinase n=1 Tax=Belliella buryatensis TaxID=1500549 RepID=A0A239DN53_9BACT|nr:HAMP domain-containing sensor histidine kinase [Belliella buryatensis]SNS33278.1 Signal transduction histidine kinase [Belliella buryatensis]